MDRYVITDQLRIQDEYPRERRPRDPEIAQFLMMLVSFMERYCSGAEQKTQQLCRIDGDEATKMF
jgi:hypothetical protein